MLKSHLIYLSLGSNVGDRRANLRGAITALPALGINPKRTSMVYETEPVDYLDQPWFLNCVVEAETTLEPLPLLHALQTVETDLGRRKEIFKGPRVIDLDILFYDAETITTSELQIPHPHLRLRRFVLTPLAELVPNLTHPTLHATIGELLVRLEDKSEVRRVEGTL